MEISGKNEDRSYTRNTELTQNPRYNCSNCSTRYKRYKTNEKNSRYRNYTYLENIKKSLIINTKSSEEEHITQDNKSIQIKIILNICLLQKEPF